MEGEDIEGGDSLFQGPPPDPTPLQRANSAPQYAPIMSPRSSPFVQFKHNCAILAGMGFSIEQSQEALFRAVRDGVPLTNILQASIEMLVEGNMFEELGHIDEETGEVRRKSASEFEDIRMSAVSPDMSTLPEVSPDMRRAVSDPVPETPAMFEEMDSGKSPNNKDSERGSDLRSDNSFTEEVRNAMFGGESETANPLSTPQQLPPRLPTTTTTTTTSQPAGPTHAALAADNMHCGICWDNLTRDKMIEMEDCKHTFCYECVNGWLTSYISDGKLILHCPSAASDQSAVCRRVPPMSQHKIEGLITKTYEGTETPPALLEKYRRFREARDLESNARVRWCTSPGCGSAIHPNFWTGSLGGRKITCSVCKYDQCYDCGRAFHGSYSTLAYVGISGTTCETLTDKTLEEYARNKHLQPCPNCKKPVEKIDACPHMTCPCGHQWCWVCRASYPCSGVHFGVSGSGSGEEIGSVLGVQRLSVVARFISALFTPLFAAVAFSCGLALWSCYCCILIPVKGCCDCGQECSSKHDYHYPEIKHDTPSTTADGSGTETSQNTNYTCFEWMTIYRRIVLNRFRRARGGLIGFRDSVLELAFPNEEGILLLNFGPCLLVGGICLFALVLSVSYALGILCIGGAVLYLFVEAVIACLKRSRQLRRAVYALPDDPTSNEDEAVPLDSSLDLNIDPIGMSGSYKGPLPKRVWQGGRLCLAGAVYAVCMPISVALSCALCPVYPFIPLPLLLNPRGRISLTKLIPLAILLAAGTAACIWYWLLSEHWTSGLGLSGGVLGAFRSLEDFLHIQGGSNLEAKLIIVAVFFGISLCGCGTWLYKAPTSFCACCTPTWIAAYSIPFAIASGKRNAMDALAFTPPPDVPTQLPLVVACELCTGSCGWDSD